MIDFLKVKKAYNSIISFFLNNSFAIFLTLLLIIKPYFISKNYYLNFIDNIFIVLIFLIVSVKSLKNISIYNKFVILFLFMSIFPTLLHGNILEWIKYFIKFSAISLYTELLIKNNVDIFFKSFKTLIDTLIVLTFVTTIIYPNGIYGNEMILLGYDNSTVVILGCGALLSCFISYYYYLKTTQKSYIFSGIIVFLLVILIYIIRWSVGAIISCISAVLFILLSIIILKFGSKTKKIYLPLNLLFGASILIFVLIVCLGFQKYFGYLIVSILKKDITLTNRTYIWNLCFKTIRKYPLFGMGIHNYSERLMLYGIYHAHSNFLNIILESGFVGFITYICIWGILSNSVDKSKTFLRPIICSLFLSFLVATLVDVIDNNELFYISAVIGYFLPYIEDNIKERKKDKKLVNRVLLLIDSGLPIPASKGGAIETLVDSIIDENNKHGKYIFDVYSLNNQVRLPISNEKCNYYYINSKSLIYKIGNIYSKILKKFFNKYISFFNIILIQDLILHNKLNYYNYIIIENNPSMIDYLHNKIKAKYYLHLHNDIDFLQHSNISFGLYDSIICCSNFISNRIKEHFKCKNVVTVYNGVSVKELKKYENFRKEFLKQYNISKSNIIIGYCGRICAEKGVKELLLSFIEIYKSGKDVYLVITGKSFFKNSLETPYIKEIKEIALPYKDRIIFTGYLNHEEIGKFYASIDIYVQPSIVNEACPLTIIEAQIMNKIIITTDSGGIPELIKNKNVVIVNRKKLVENIKDSLINIIDNYDKFNKIKKDISIEKIYDDSYFAVQFLKKIK